MGNTSGGIVVNKVRVTNKPGTTVTSRSSDGSYNIETDTRDTEYFVELDLSALEDAQRQQVIAAFDRSQGAWALDDDEGIVTVALETSFVKQHSIGSAEDAVRVIRTRITDISA